jgi:hypothetical protein
LLMKLETMRVKEPTAVLTALHLFGLEHARDFAILDSSEREEMMSGLGAQGISLGDRSKARYHFGALEGVHGFVDADNAGCTHPRRTQGSSGGGLSADSIALIATAALGIFSFLVQVYSSGGGNFCTGTLVLIAKLTTVCL